MALRNLGLRSNLEHEPIDMFLHLYIMSEGNIFGISMTHFSSLEPTTAILFKRLDPRLEFRLLQAEVVNCSNARYTHAGKSFRSPVHQRAANRAKAVLHPVSCSNGIGFLETAKVVFAADVFQMAVLDDETNSDAQQR